MTETIDHKNLAKRFQEQQRIMTKKFQQSSDLDSMVFVEVPGSDLKTVRYKIWLIEEVEVPWMRDFNGNSYYCPNWNWNDEEGGICGKFRELSFMCKWYRFDGTHEEVVPGDFRAKRGFWIRDHYSEMDVSKIQLIGDNLQEYLASQRIDFTRFNFYRATREMIKS